MLIWSCALNLRPKSPRGDQSKQIFNSWQVDLVLFEPADPRFVTLKAKANAELSHLDRSWHFQKLTPAQIELDQMRKAGYGDQRFIVKHLHPWWQGSQGYDDYMQLESLAMSVMPFEPSKLKSDDSLVFAPLIDVAQLVRVIDFGSVLGGQTFDVDPERYIPTVRYNNTDESRFTFDDCVQRKKVNVQYKFNSIVGCTPVGYPEPNELFGHWGIDEMSQTEQKEQQVISAQSYRIDDIKNGTTNILEKGLKKPLGKPNVSKLEQLNWNYGDSYRNDKYNNFKYFLTDVNSNLDSRFEVEHLLTTQQEGNSYDSPLENSAFDFGPEDLSNEYYKIKDEKVNQYVDHWITDKNGKAKRISSYDEIAFTAQDYALTAFLRKVKDYVRELKGC